VAKIDITKNANYQIENVMRFRGKVLRQELHAIMERLDVHISNLGAEKAKISIVAIHTLYMDTKEYDVEVFIPVDKPIPSSEEFDFMPNFHLENCALIKHRDDLRLLPELFTKIYYELTEIDITIEQPFYVISTKSPVEICEMQIINADIYVRTLQV
jgi:hypothetical protein